MDLLEKINNCKDEELTLIIDDALKNSITNSEKKERLGFPDNSTEKTKIAPHKGFISPNSRIKHNNSYMNTYSMKTTDYFYEFANYIKNNKINKKFEFIKCIENFINEYFGICDGIDKRDEYFEQIAWKTTNTDKEYFEKLNNIEIGEFKEKNIAMCTERAAIAQNLLSLFGFEVYYCMGCINNNGIEEGHCFNIARANDVFVLLDYSLPVSIYKNNQIIDYSPFQGIINPNELEDILINGINKSFNNYILIKTTNGNNKTPTDEFRIYNVGTVSFKYTQQKNK